MITIACSNRMAKEGGWDDLKAEIIEQLDNVLDLGQSIAKDVIISININNHMEKVQYTKVEKLNQEIWRAWKKDFDLDKLKKYPSLNIDPKDMKFNSDLED